jgi:hypothetical protein
MKIYIASSWKRADECIKVKDALEAADILVSLFCFPGHRTCDFNWADLSRDPSDDTVSFMKKHPIVKKAYKEDRAFLDSCDALVMVYPAGISAHLELGTALGQNKPTFIIGDLTGLNPEVWYLGVTDIFWMQELDKLVDRLKDHEKFINSK